MSKNTRVLALTASLDDLASIDSIVEANSPWLTRYAVHKLAMRLGLQRLMVEPELAKELVSTTRRNSNR